MQQSAKTAMLSLDTKDPTLSNEFVGSLEDGKSFKEQDPTNLEEAKKKYIPEVFDEIRSPGFPG